jgi:Tfp pilus assembly protein PilP
MRKFIFFACIFSLLLALTAHSQEEEFGEPQEDEMLESQEEGVLDTLEDLEEPPFPIEDFLYTDKGKRDPFTPLIRKTQKNQRRSLINIENIYMIGTMQTDKEIVALVKEKGGKGHILKEGDSVAEGEVEKIGPDYVTFILTQYGLETRRTLKLREGTWSEMKEMGQGAEHGLQENSE